MINFRARSQRRRLLVQVALFLVTALAIWGAVESARTNLSALGVTSGFGFLDRATGWSYSFSLVERDINDTYARTLTIGLMNTAFVGLVSIFLSTILGFAMGTARDASNIAIRTVATVYVQIFRNIPLILQIVFLYAVMIKMPGPRQAMSLGEVAFLSNRGLMVPVLNVPVSIALGLCAVSLALAVILVLIRPPVMRGFLIWLGGTVLFCALAGFAFAPAGESVLSVPALKGLRFVGGVTVSTELLAMIVGIVLYGGAYIAEIVRGGLEEVPRGLIEAGEALGLTKRAIWSRVKMPMALRTIIPPLGNQWIFIMKATTIGVAIGFSDLFYIVSTSITQSGQTLELIAILMGAFLAMNFAIAQFVNWLNNRLKLKAH